MSAAYWNHLSGVVDNAPLLSGGTTLNSTALASMPAIVAPAFMWLVLDPSGTAGAPEIVKVTAHTASATSCTIVRGQQTATSAGGGAARQHLVNTVWVAAQTVSDFDELPFRKLTSTGDLLYGSAANVASRLELGNTGLVLRSNGTAPAWAQVTDTGIASDAVTTAKILDANVTRAKLAADALPSSAAVATSQSTTSTSYTDLATPGPAVTLTTSTAVRVTFAATVSNNQPLDSGNVGFAVTGATSKAAPAGIGAITFLRNDGPAATLSISLLITDLTPGSNTFTMKYRAEDGDLSGGAGTATFANRFISVERLN